MSVRETYEAALTERGYTTDPAQQRAIDALERCAQEWTQYKQRRSNALKKVFIKPQIPRGVYMAGQELFDGLLLQRGADPAQDTVAFP